MANSRDGILPERLEEIKREVVLSTLKFFVQELNNSNLDSEQKESLSVAKQCLEACYEVEEDKARNATDLVQLFSSSNIPPLSGNLQDLVEEAEKFKCMGNDAMKEGEYTIAIGHYNNAIRINNTKAIYYCNRAAALSRLERDKEAIEDCKKAIRLDPTYGKAYGRLGIAYSNLSMFKEAAEAYKQALQLDPTNVSYEANLKLAEEKIEPANASGLNFDFPGFMNNPALLNMASQMLNDPSFRNMVSGLMNSGPVGDPNLDSFVEVGQQLAEHMQANNPDILENLRQTLTGRAEPSSAQPDAEPSTDVNNSEDNKKNN